MGFFKRLLTTDPGTLIEKAGKALERGEAAHVLELLGKLPDELSEELSDEQRERRVELDRRARETLPNSIEQVFPGN